MGSFIRRETPDKFTMKTILVLLSLASMAMGQAMPECRCGFFVTLFTWEIEIHCLPAINLASCDDVDGCVLACKTEADKLTNHGDMYFELSNGYNVGQELCLGSLTHFAPDMWHEYVHGYANVCHGPWLYTQFTLKEELCCYMGRFFTCPTKATPLDGETPVQFKSILTNPILIE